MIRFTIKWVQRWTRGYSDEDTEKVFEKFRESRDEQKPFVMNRYEFAAFRENTFTADDDDAK